jgi:hypothetical protein
MRLGRRRAPGGDLGVTEELSAPSHRFHETELLSSHFGPENLAVSKVAYDWNFENARLARDQFRRREGLGCVAVVSRIGGSASAAAANSNTARFARFRRTGYDQLLRKPVMSQTSDLDRHRQNYLCRQVRLPSLGFDPLAWQAN